MYLFVYVLTYFGKYFLFTSVFCWLLANHKFVHCLWKGDEWAGEQEGDGLFF